VILFAVSSYFGLKALKIVSWIFIPLVFILAFVALSRFDSGISQASLGDGENITMYAGIGIVMSSWIMGVLTCLPDLTRFCKNRVQGALVGAVGILLGNSLTFIIGGLGAYLSGESDPARILLSFGYTITK